MEQDVFDVMDGYDRASVEAELENAKREVEAAKQEPSAWLEGDISQRHRIIFNRRPSTRELWADAPADARLGVAEHALLTIGEVEAGLRHMETDAQGRLRRPKVKVEVTG